LYGHAVIEACCGLLGREFSHIALLAAEHHEYLPRAPIFGDAAELGAAEIAHILAIENVFNAIHEEHSFSLANLRGRLNYDISIVFALHQGVKSFPSSLDKS
jgi:hypothetical protein